MKFGSSFGIVVLHGFLMHACGILSHAMSPDMPCEQANARTDKITRAFQLVNKLLDSSQDFSPWGENGEMGYELKDSAFTMLDSLLQLPIVARYNIECLLPSISISSSPDKRLWIFQVDENSGGSFYSYITLWHMRDKKGRIVRTSRSRSVGEEEADYWGGDIGLSIIQQIDTLGQTIYVVEEGAGTCNTCAVWGISTWKVNDSAGLEQIDGISLDYRIGDAETDYNRSTKTIMLRYQIDDLSGGHLHESMEIRNGGNSANESEDNEENEPEGEEDMEDYSGKVITETWKFDGYKFVLSRFTVEEGELQQE
jgi:hypothetical protein